MQARGRTRSSGTTALTAYPFGRQRVGVRWFARWPRWLIQGGPPSRRERPLESGNGLRPSLMLAGATGRSTATALRVRR